MAQQLTCGICLLSFDLDERQTEAVEDEGQVKGEGPLPVGARGVWCKLEDIGFRQVPAGNKVPFPLCTWCTSRVEDAYELKLQCAKASHAFYQNDANLQMCTSVATLLDHVRTSETNSAPSLPREEAPGLTKIASKRSHAGATVSVVMAGAHDMFTCVRNLSMTLRHTSSLLASAVQFTENTLSLLAVLSSLTQESVAMMKSATTIRKEAEMWKVKSAMMADATSFVKDVSCTNLVRDRVHSEPPNKVPKVSEVTEANVTVAPSCVSKVASTSVQHNASLKKEYQYSSTVCSSSSSKQTLINCNLDADKIDNDDTPSSLESQSVRRSHRSRSVVDHLVYWPSFKKHGPVNGKLPTTPKSQPSRPDCGSLTSVEALDSLLLRRDVDSDCENASNEKWAIIKKKKEPRKRKPSQIKVRFSSFMPNPACVSSRTKTEDLHQGLEEEMDKGVELKNEDGDHEEDKPENLTNCANIQSVKDGETQEVQVLSPIASSPHSCNICGKKLSCSRNLKAHIKMHIGSSPYQCNYCHKVFSSSWNRAQHERVHTGEKPYVCDVCHEPFRYNVSLRHHKLKTHGIN